MDDQTEVPVTEDDRKKLLAGLAASQDQREQVQEDLDASLDEPTIPGDAMPCDFCGVKGHSFEDCPKADDLENEMTSSATVSSDYQQRQNKHAALDMAIRVVTSPHSPFRTERASADEIVAYAEKFAEFLDG